MSSDNTWTIGVPDLLATDPLRTDCELCGARPGEPCIRLLEPLQIQSGYLYYLEKPHSARQRAVEQLRSADQRLQADRGNLRHSLPGFGLEPDPIL